MTNYSTVTKKRLESMSTSLSQMKIEVYGAGGEKPFADSYSSQFLAFN